MEYKIYNKKKLEDGLLQMSGKDFAAAEKEARIDGDQSIDIMTSRTFYAAIAARVFKVRLDDIKELSLKEYAVITGDVGSFLLAPSKNTEESQISSDK